MARVHHIFEPPFTSAAWYSSGRTVCLPRHGEVVEHCEKLVANGTLSRAGLSEPSAGTWWAFDATWSTPDGTTVRARMTLSPDDPAGRDPLRYESDAALTVPGTITIVAEADRAWDYAAWPSPAAMFLDRRFPWGPTGGVEYAAANSTDNLQAAQFSTVVQEFGRVAWCTVVVTHDAHDACPIHWANAGSHAPPLARRIRTLNGRMLELRIHGADRVIVNRALQRIGLELPFDGAVILLSGARRRALHLTPQDVQFRSFPGILHNSAVTPLIERLTDIAGAPWSTDARPAAALTDLRENWLTGTEGNPELSIVARLRTQVEELKATLRGRAETERDLRRELATATVQRDREREAARRTSEETATLLQAHGRESLAHELAQARERLHDCEEELDIAAALLDDRARRNTWLERELANAGRPQPPSAPDPTSPASWEELLASGATLPYIALDRMDARLEPLRGHPLEAVWLRRAWTSLRALSAYAETKKTLGATALPHFTAYLRSPQAPIAIPAGRYVPSESEPVLTNRKFRQARTFSVPTTVCPDGQVLMEEHIRVGSGRPPAPRLYFYDDTSGATGNVLVGYLGKHLSAPQTN